MVWFGQTGGNDLMKLTFNKIHRESIFRTDFDALSADNGTIEFKRKSNSFYIYLVLYIKQSLSCEYIAPMAWR